jgi:hypothetical protein
MPKTTLDTHVQAPPAVLFRDLDGEAILLNTSSGNYFGLDAVGTRMWQSLTEAGSVAQAYATLLHEYKVTPERLKADLFVFVDKLCDKALLVRVPEAN